MVSPLRPENDFRRYCCVSCLAPTQTLLTQYSTRSALKLTRCQTCGLDVDPYVEREELLVSHIIMRSERLPIQRGQSVSVGGCHLHDSQFTFPDRMATFSSQSNLEENPTLDK